METPVKPIAPNTPHICSAAEALALLRKHGGHGNAAFMRSLADAVSDENNHITGTVGDFNNLIDRFEALGDYFAGPNHTLPTNGTARFSSPLSVDDFVKKSQFSYYTPEALARVCERVACFARKEGLDAHAKSALIRSEEGAE